ncbi:hypothetical protein QYS49_37985 [Marivirga salinae]|uniref:Outer membrane protein beta-barrel domain-containing protein n=1 Tax=Marivirga salinarum TaxID=3059078 RepID=A0AA51NAF7_9BACT|nr:hypothetical protein [Marivirga sp. BDSF4-3]WMN11330.1 hypothetical protein QYS49_37985 [Marivirga sp. BDSF4-3]
MKKFKSLIFAVLIFMTTYEMTAQIYAGGGFVYSSLSQQGLDDVTGFGIDIQKEFTHEGGKFSLNPTVHITVLNSNIFREFNAFYANTISFAPSVGYKILEGNRISITPFASPFIGWLTGYRNEDVFFDAGFRNEIIYGLEFGLEIKVALYENLELKLNPITFQIGDNDFRQGMISVLFRLSK